jgi:hypothetical protein
MESTVQLQINVSCSQTSPELLADAPSAVKLQLVNGASERDQNINTAY